MTEATNTTAVAAPQTPGAILAKPLSIKDTVIAQFREAEDGLKAMAEKYRDVVYDVTTTKGMNEAKAARAELRDDGRRLLTRTAAKVKADVNELKQVMGDEVDRLVAIVKPVEDAIDAQIKAEEQRKADEKAERDRIEAERVAAHRANIEQLRGYASSAEGQPLQTIKGAIEKLAEMTFGEEWEEFAQQAQAERDNTVSSLRSLVQREEQRIENENLRAQLAALQATPPAAQEVAPKAALALDSQSPEAINFEAEAGTADASSAAQADTPFQVDSWDDDGEESRIAAHQGAAAAVIDKAAAPGPASIAATAADDGTRLKLGEICDRIAPLSITADGLTQLGFPPVATAKTSKLYRASDLPKIVAAMQAHLQRAIEAETA